MSDSLPLTLEAAHQVLKGFDCGATTTTPLAIDRPLIQQALQAAIDHSDYQMFGVCADSIEQGLVALTSYLAALGYEDQPMLTPIEGAIYIKFNTRTGLCYADTYTGNHRGVLVSCQSAYDDKLNEMYGHLPLDLFTA